MYKWITIVFFSIAAMSCYVFGGLLGLVLLIGLGLVFELFFWRGLINKLKKPKQS